jgi:hypothetical protein
MTRFARGATQRSLLQEALVGCLEMPFVVSRVRELALSDGHRASPALVVLEVPVPRSPRALSFSVRVNELGESASG